MAIVILLQRPSSVGIVFITAGYGILIVPVARLMAVSRCFNGVSRHSI